MRPELYFTELQPPRKAARRLLDELKSFEDDLEEVLDAIERPSCDWSVVGDVMDSKKMDLRVSFLNELGSFLKLRSISNAYLGNHKEAINDLSLSCHLFGHQVEGPTFIGGMLTLVSLGQVVDQCRIILEMSQLEVEDCDRIVVCLEKLEQDLSWKSLNEAHTLRMLDQYENDSKRVRAEYIQALGLFGGIVIADLPDDVFGISLYDLEKSLNIGLIHILPKGWIRRNAANYLDFVSLPDALENEIPETPYNAFVLIYRTSLARHYDMVKRFRYRIACAKIAVGLEREKSLNGVYPDFTSVELPSDRFGITEDENGRPAFWFSIDEPVDPTLSIEEVRERGQGGAWVYRTDLPQSLEE